MAGFRTILNLTLQWLSLVFMFYCLARLLQHRTKHFFHSRRVILCITEISSLITTAIIRALGFTLALDTNHPAITTTSNIFISLVGPMMSFTLFIVMLRVFFLNFDHKFKQSAMNSRWASTLQLNDTLSESFDWYLNNKKTWGNVKWIFLRTVWLPLIGLIPVILIAASGGESNNPALLSVGRSLSTVWSGFFLLGCGIAIIVIWFRLPKHPDEIFLRQELRLSACAFLIAIIGIGLLVVCPFGVTDESASCLAKDLMWHISQVMDAFISTLFVIYKNSDHAEQTLRNTISEPAEKHHYWTEYVAEKPSNFFLFANFLVSEFSIENLLFISEYLQFKQDYKSQIHKELEDSQSVGYWIDLPQELLERRQRNRRQVSKSNNLGGGQDQRLGEEPPPALIPVKTISESGLRRLETGDTEVIHTSEESREFILFGFSNFGQFFYNKYISPDGAMFMINISGHLRRELFDIYEGEGITTPRPPSTKFLLQKLDDSASEVSRLLTDSYMRFRKKMRDKASVKS